MSNGISRRDWLKLIGGSAVGLMLTPVPWKILDDSAKWTQNWSWTPVPLDGSICYKHTTCTLCPMGCGVRVKCVANKENGSIHPVSMNGVTGHPASDGSLCVMGLAGHLLRHHPSRLLRPFKRVEEKGAYRMLPISLGEAVSEIAAAISSSDPDSVAIFDARPNRTISFVYREFLGKLKNGLYINPPIWDGVPTDLTRRVLRTGNLVFGFDIENSRTILSFGAPLLDGWGTQGQFSAIVRGRCRSDADRLRIIQLEPTHSMTAQLGDEWIPVRPGTEAQFALGLAHVILKEKLCDATKLREHSIDFQNTTELSFTTLVSPFSPSFVSEQTGIPDEKVIRIARELATRKPSLVVFGGNAASGPFSPEEQLIFMDLNILLGAIGTRGGLVARQELPGPFGSRFVTGSRASATANQLADIPDHSICVLIMDGSDSGNAIPWSLIQKKLSSRKRMVISLASHLDGDAAHADYILPSPAYLEMMDDNPTPATAWQASYSLTVPILSTPGYAIHPVDFIKKIASAIHAPTDSSIESLGIEPLLKDRVKNIHSTGTGGVFDAETGRSVKLSELSPSEFYEKLKNGGCWSDDKAVRLPELRFSFLGGEASGWQKLSCAAGRRTGFRPLVLLPVGSRGAGSIAQSNSMMTKLYRESDLRTPGNTISVNPSTGKENGLDDGGKATVTTEIGSASVKIRFDGSVMPGILEATVGPQPDSFDRVETQNQNRILDLSKIESDSTWRITKAEVTPA